MPLLALQTVIICIITGMLLCSETQDVYHILILSSIGSKAHLLLMAFTLFVTLTKDHNNHDNLIFRRRGCSRARYKKTINECSRDKRGSTKGAGGKECEKVNSKNGTRSFTTFRSRLLDLHTDRLTASRRGNVTTPSWCLACSLASCKCVHRWLLPGVLVWLTPHLLQLCSRNSRLLDLLKQMKAVMKAGEEKGTERKKSISRTNASQQKRAMKWLFKHSAVFYISTSQCIEKHIYTVKCSVSIKTSRYWVEKEKSRHYPECGVLAQLMLFTVKEFTASEAGLVTSWTYVEPFFHLSARCTKSHVGSSSIYDLHQVLCLQTDAECFRLIEECDQSVCGEYSVKFNTETVWRRL